MLYDICLLVICDQQRRQTVANVMFRSFILFLYTVFVFFVFFLYFFNIFFELFPPRSLQLTANFYSDSVSSVFCFGLETSLFVWLEVHSRMMSHGLYSATINSFISSSARSVGIKRFFIEITYRKRENSLKIFPKNSSI